MTPLNITIHRVDRLTVEQGRLIIEGDIEFDQKIDGCLILTRRESDILSNNQTDSINEPLTSNKPIDVDEPNLEVDIEDISSEYIGSKPCIETFIEPQNPTKPKFILEKSKILLSQLALLAISKARGDNIFQLKEVFHRFKYNSESPFAKIIDETYGPVRFESLAAHWRVAHPPGHPNCHVLRCIGYNRSYFHPSRTSNISINQPGFDVDIAMETIIEQLYRYDCGLVMKIFAPAKFEATFSNHKWKHLFDFTILQ